MQWLAQLGIIPKWFANVNAPICKACGFADAKKKAVSCEGCKVDDCHDDKPCAGVSVDTMEASMPGLLLPSTSSLLPKEQYEYCTLFVDHHTCIIYAVMHEANGGKEAVLGKTQYEWFAKMYDVPIHHIHADNGIFTSKALLMSVIRRSRLTLSVGLEIISRMVSLNIILVYHYSGPEIPTPHSVSLWSDIITVEHWPYCIHQVVNFTMSVSVRTKNTVPLLCLQEKIHLLSWKIFMFVAAWSKTNESWMAITSVDGKMCSTVCICWSFKRSW
jgi:hypothetical protein